MESQISSHRMFWLSGTLVAFGVIESALGATFGQARGDFRVRLTRSRNDTICCRGCFRKRSGRFRDNLIWLGATFGRARGNFRVPSGQFQGYRFRIRRSFQVQSCRFRIMKSMLGMVNLNHQRVFQFLDPAAICQIEWYCPSVLCQW